VTYDLAAIRARLSDPREVADALGIIDGPKSVRRHSRGIVIRCPVHAERTPSCLLTRSPTGISWHCFGCKAGGGLFDLIAVRAGLDADRDFRRVAAIAAQMAGIREGESVEFQPPPPPPEPPRLDDETFDVIASVIAQRCPVAASAEASDYLGQRGLYDAAAGACASLPGDRAGQGRLVNAIVSDVGREAWMLSGLAYDDGGFAFPDNRLVAFWRDEHGKTVQTIQRRALRTVEDQRKYVFARGRSPRWPYGLEHAPSLGPAGEVAFCEGFLDALALRELSRMAGYDRLALGIPGTGNWKQPWARLAAGRVAVVATDPDDAGNDCALRIAPDLFAAGAVDVKRATPDGAHDWADALRATRRVRA